MHSATPPLLQQVHPWECPCSMRTRWDLLFPICPTRNGASLRAKVRSPKRNHEQHHYSKQMPDRSLVITTAQHFDNSPAPTPRRVPDRNVVAWFVRHYRRVPWKSIPRCALAALCGQWELRSRRCAHIHTTWTRDPAVIRYAVVRDRARARLTQSKCPTTSVTISEPTGCVCPP